MAAEPADTVGAQPLLRPSPPPAAEETPAASAQPAARSFSELLAGATAESPRPVGLTPILEVPVDAVPCLVAPAAQSPGQFSMTHEAVVATITTQAQMQPQAAHPSSSGIFSSSLLQPISPVPLQQVPPPIPEDSRCKPPRVEMTQSSDLRSHSTQIALKKKSDDGYNWRKYGQKQVKSGENFRSYYKCTSANCSAKKKVQCCPDGRVTEVMYRGQHNHDPPEQTRLWRERVVRSTGRSREEDNLKLLNIEPNESDPSIFKTGKNSGNGTPDQQLFCSSNCEGDAAIKTEDDLGTEPYPKRRPSECTVPLAVPALKTFREPRIILQAASDVGRVNDGYKWRKYGQKIVKGNSNPRSYYRCTYNGCPVRKHVEIASDDAKAIVITYEGKHNHDLPGTQNSNDAPASPLVTITAPANLVEQLHSSDSLWEKKPSTELQTNVDEEKIGEKALELGDKKALESAQALLSFRSNSSEGEDGGGTDSESIKRSLLNENPAAVPMQNS